MEDHTEASSVIRLPLDSWWVPQEMVLYQGLRVHLSAVDKRMFSPISVLLGLVQIVDPQNHEK